jgi:hypothetical protein
MTYRHLWKQKPPAERGAEAATWITSHLADPVAFQAAFPDAVFSSNRWVARPPASDNAVTISQP